MVNMNQVASAAYGATQKLPTGSGSGRIADTKVSFADLLEDGVDSVIETQHKSETLSADMVQGKGDINDVIMATQEADMVLNTVVAIRDKIIQAYQDVLRMAI